MFVLQGKFWSWFDYWDGLKNGGPGLVGSQQISRGSSISCLFSLRSYGGGSCQQCWFNARAPLAVGPRLAGPYKMLLFAGGMRAPLSLVMRGRQFSARLWPGPPWPW